MKSWNIIEIRVWKKKLPEINACDILVFAGGPGYCNGFYPRMAPVTDDLNKIKIPVMLLGMMVGTQFRCGQPV